MTYSCCHWWKHLSISFKLGVSNIEVRRLDLISRGLESILQATASSSKATAVSCLQAPSIIIFPWMFKVQLLAPAIRNKGKSEQSNAKSSGINSASLPFSSAQKWPWDLLQPLPEREQSLSPDQHFLPCTAFFVQTFSSGGKGIPF